jgi:Tol biopolymer transport system component
MNADGSGATQVTNTAENELPGGWSKDGTRIVVDFSTLTSGHLSKGDIAVVAVASGATTNLTNTSGINEEHPNW